MIISYLTSCAFVSSKYIGLIQSSAFLQMCSIDILVLLKNLLKAASLLRSPFRGCRSLKITQTFCYTYFTRTWITVYSVNLDHSLLSALGSQSTRCQTGLFARHCTSLSSHRYAVNSLPTGVWTSVTPDLTDIPSDSASPIWKVRNRN